MLDDFNTAITIAQLFEAVRIINSVNAGTETISAEDLDLLKQTYDDFVFKILGLKAEQQQDKGSRWCHAKWYCVYVRKQKKKGFCHLDKIRDELTQLSVSKIKDEKRHHLLDQK